LLGVGTFLNFESIGTFCAYKVALQENSNNGGGEEAVIS